MAMVAGCETPKSPLQNLQIKVGMKRAEVEELIESAIGKESEYNEYSMYDSTEGKYNDGNTILIIQYKPGFPAPWVKTPDGNIEHLPPIDAEVLSWKYVDDKKD